MARKKKSGVVKRMLLSTLYIVGGVYVGLSLLVFLMQKEVIFHPSKTISMTPDMLKMDYDDCFFKTSDNLTLNGWYVPADKAVFTVLFCHGNAGNIGNRLDTIETFNKMGCNIFVFDYREYGKSEGSLSEEGLYRDAEAAWKYLTDKKGVKPEKIIIVGRSLGGAVAANLAASKNTHAATVLECTFSSVVDMGKKVYPFLPVSLLSRYKLSTYDSVKKLKGPKLFLHAVDDEIVPFELGMKNFNISAEPKSFVELTGGHNDCYFSDPEYSKNVSKFINSLEKSK